MEEIRLILEDVGHSFEGKTLFSHLHIEVKSGDCLAITGSNGSGKSTLLRLIAGLERPACGQVKFSQGGRTVSRGSYPKIIGMVSSQVIMYPTLTALENLRFFLESRQIHQTPTELQEQLRRFGLAGQEKKQVRLFSTGMHQRLKLAGLMASYLPVMLLDEPASNLDEAGKKLVDELVRQALSDKKLVILASNELREIAHGNKYVRLS